jgi:hypothetical protein
MWFSVRARPAACREDNSCVHPQLEEGQFQFHTSSSIVGLVVGVAATGGTAEPFPDALDGATRDGASRIMLDGAGEFSQ